MAEKLITETWELIAETKDKLQAIADKDFALLRVSSKGGFVAQGTINTNYYNPDAGFGLKIPNGYPENNDAISLEGLVEMDPDYIIIQHTPSLAEAAIKENESLEVWKSLKAVKNDQVLIFDGSLNSMSVLSVRLAAEKFQALVDSI